MKRIIKGTEPESLTHYRASINSDKLLGEEIYNDFREKTKEGCKTNEKGNLRLSLLKEQGFICCYCMSRVSCQNSRIEHYKSQTNNRNLQITYTNLFIACNGVTNGNLHCDNSKGENELSGIDLLANIENKIYYTQSGEICSNDNVISSELNNILNLNDKILKKNRMQAYSDMLERLKTKHASSFSQEFICKHIEKYTNKNSDGKFPEYQGMLLFFMKRWLRKFSRVNSS